MCSSDLNGDVECRLCPHRCRLKEGKSGICKVRGMSQGKLATFYYGTVATGGQADPIEKKPLHNFYPGTKVLSFGGISCNLKCEHCQNYSLSQEYDQRYLIAIDAEQIVSMARQQGCLGVAWTYNEPLIHFETYYDWSRSIKKEGLFTVLVTNGFISPEPFQKIAPFIDAANIDVKAFTEEFYRKYTRSRLQPVLDTCTLARKCHVHLELTYLIIPTLNDSSEEIERYLDWVGEHLGHDVPLHFSGFHPAYKMTRLSPTPAKKVIESVELALEKKFHYVYAGNIYPNPFENTRCPSCQKTVVERSGYTVKKVAVTPRRECCYCSSPLEIIC